MTISTSKLGRYSKNSPRSFPRLDLQQHGALRGFVAAFRFLPQAWTSIARKQIQFTPTFHFVDRNELPIGIASGDICYSSAAEAMRRLFEIIVQVEDRRFYSHVGIDPVAIIRALVRNILAGHVVQGASTITQQLVRNSLLTPHRSLTRKLLELILALAVERHYSKAEILTLYAHLVYLGPGIRGFPAASKLIFRRNIEALDDLSLCGLVGLLRLPSKTYPFGSSERFIARQGLIARLRARSNSCETTCDTRVTEQRVINPIKVMALKLDGWTAQVDAVAHRQRSNMPEANGNLRRVRLTVHRPYQAALDRVLRDATGDQNIREAAGVILCRESADILAEATWHNMARSDFLATRSRSLQPGSTFKPFAYLAALEYGYSAEMQLESRPFVSEYIRTSNGVPWCVRNYGDRYHGPLTLNRALQLSDNTVFARLAELLGNPRLAEVYARFGLCERQRVTPAIVLGGIKNGVSLLRLATAYASIGNSGVYNEPRLFRTLIFDDQSFQVVNRPSSSRIVIHDESVLSALHRALRNASNYAGLSLFSGKTGTTRRGSIFAGYDDRVSIAIWLSYRHSPAEDAPKGLKASQVARRLLQRALLGHQHDEFTI